MKLKFICSAIGICLCLTACEMPSINRQNSEESVIEPKETMVLLTDEEKSGIFLQQAYSEYKGEIGETIPGKRIVEKTTTDFEWDFSVYEFDETGFTHKYYLIAYDEDTYQYNISERLRDLEIVKKSLRVDDINHVVSFSLDYVNMGDNSYEYFRKKICDDFETERIRLELEEGSIVKEIHNAKMESVYSIIGDLVEYEIPIPELEVDSDGYELCLSDDKYWKYKKNQDDTISVIGYDCEWLGTKLVIPSEIDGKEVYSITEMKPIEGIVCIEVASGISELVGAFKGWESLEELQLNAGLLSISNGTLKGTKVKTVELPDSMIYVEDYFYEGLEVGDVSSLPESMNGLGKMYSKSEITTIVIPETVKKIAAEAFSGCDRLTIVHLAEGVEEIGAEAFYECASLQAIAVPASVSEIGNNAFNGDTLLVVPKGSYAQQYAQEHNLLYSVQDDIDTNN